MLRNRYARKRFDAWKMMETIDKVNNNLMGSESMMDGAREYYDSAFADLDQCDSFLDQIERAYSSSTGMKLPRQMKALRANIEKMRKLLQKQAHPTIDTSASIQLCEDIREELHDIWDAEMTRLERG